MAQNKKVCLMGASTSTNNRGVSALAVSMVKILLTLWPDSELSFIIGSRDSSPQKIVLADKEIQVRTIGYRISPKANPVDHLFVVILVSLIIRLLPFSILKQKLSNKIPIIREMLDADIIADIQGGDSFSDIYGLRRFFVSIALPVVALLLEKRFILLPQTYGPYSHRIARYFAGKIISSAETVLSRDFKSIKISGELVGVKKRKIHFCPDVAFLLDSRPMEKISIEPSIDFNRGPVVGININGLMYNGGYTRSNMFGLKADYKKLVNKLIAFFIDNGVTVLLIPHTYGAPDNVNSDPYACKQVFDIFSGKKIHIITAEYNQSEIKGIIGMCDFFIGSRMHSCIAALSQSIPTVGIAYSDKFIGVFDSVKVKNTVIDCREFEANEIVEKVGKMFETRGELKKILSSSIPEIQQKIINSFKQYVI